MERKLKPKKCRLKSCRQSFTPWNSTQVACSHPCALALVKEKKAKAHKAETRAMRAKFNTTDRSYQIKKTTEACHRFIRERDKGEACIACGIRTGQFHASHFYTIGHAPELRFHPDNIHMGCAQCNSYKAGNIPEYSVGLEKKIGRDRVENLARCRTPQNLTLDDLKEIQQWYKDQYQWLINRDNLGSIR